MEEKRNKKKVQGDKINEGREMEREGVAFYSNMGGIKWGNGVAGMNGGKTH